MLGPRYSGPLPPTAFTTIKLWGALPFYLLKDAAGSANCEDSDQGLRL